MPLGKRWLQRAELLMQLELADEAVIMIFLWSGDRGRTPGFCIDEKTKELLEKGFVTVRSDGI